MLNKYDLIIVGAGPAGSIAARYAAAKGISVLVLEKDRDVGYPVRCGEAVSKRSLELFMEPDSKWIASEINKFSFGAPNGSEVVLEFSETGYVLERRIFDYALAKTASEKGAHFVMRAYVNGLLFDGDKVSGVKYLHNGIQKEINSKLVIAADGVESRVGRWAGLKTSVDFREMESCYQVTASNIQLDPDTCYFYFGKETAPEGYLWVFPKGKNTANIGIGVSGLSSKQKAAKVYLEEFLAKKFPDASILTAVAGGVPCSLTLDKISAPGIMLTGDAARQVNPLSGGGISSGMIGGSLAGDIAADAILNNNLDSISKYAGVWHDRLGKKHETYNRLKDGIYNFDDNKFNDIAKAFLKVPPEKRTLGKLFTTALINKPSLLIDVAKVFF